VLPSHPDLIVLRPEGLYCPAGDFYIDPWRPVDRAVITHAHADHARSGHAAYWAHADAAGVMRARLGNINLHTSAYGEPLDVFGVKLSLHPAGHVLGSAQVRVEHQGQVWVASGDYKVAPDPSCPPFEPVKCHCFITESTFGLPIYRWQSDAQVFADIHRWWQANAQAGRSSVLCCYSFGKAQRLLSGLDESVGPLLLHGAIEPINAAYRAAGVRLANTQLLADVSERASLARALVLCPPASATSAWAKRLVQPSVAFASGWMSLRGARRRGGYDQGFALSDHADWPGLQAAIDATGCSRVIVTHGYEAVMVRHLQERGLQAGSFATEYGQDALEEATATTLSSAA
jgi:putative mRNA 3-end processing factor